MASGSEQINKLSVLEGDDGNLPPDLKILDEMTVQLEYYNNYSVLGLHTSKVYSRYNHLHIILHKIQILIFSNHLLR